MPLAWQFLNKGGLAARNIPKSLLAGVVGKVAGSSSVGGQDPFAANARAGRQVTA